MRTINSARPHGFTLVELVVSITITAIIIGFVAMFMTAPVDAYIDQSERAELNDSAQLIARSLADDLRTALPNSVRIRNVGTRSIVEMLRVDSVSFYRSTGELAGDPLRELAFAPATPDLRFSLFGRLTANGSYPYPAGGHLVVANRSTGNGTLDAYRLVGSRVITPVGTVIQVSSPTPPEESITLSVGFQFAASDTHQRMFHVIGPIAYVCNSAANARSLRRYSGYPITQNIPTTEASPQILAGSMSLVASNIASCRLRCVSNLPNDNICGELITVNIAISRQTASGNELLTIFEQFRVDNSL